MVISLEWIDVTVCKRNQHSVGGQLYFKNKLIRKEIYFVVARSKEKVKRDRILDEGKEEEIEKKEGGKARG